MIFLEKTHTYLNSEGVIIPSVTQLIAWKFSSGYDDVPQKILKAKAAYGTRIHSLVEEFCKTGQAGFRDQNEAMMVTAYAQIAKGLPKVIANEQKVCFEDRLAGTLDILYENGEIGDIKTYYQLSEHSWLLLRWQISYYYLCLYGRDMDRYPHGHLIYLPKSLKDYGHYVVEDLRTYDECLTLLKEYEEAHSANFVLKEEQQ